MIRSPRFLLALSAVEGLVLGVGLETCFGIGQYRRIMALGALGGLGIGALVRLGMGSRDRGARLVVRAAGPAAAVFAVWFLWRVLPLIREELSYSL